MLWGIDIFMRNSWEVREESYENYPPRKKLAILLLNALSVMSVWGNGIDIYTRDEQRTSTVMTGLRVKLVNQTLDTLKNVALHYRFNHPISTLASPEIYYAAGATVGFNDAQNALVILPGRDIAPGAVWPDESGISVGLHAVDWTAWDKSDDWSQPGSELWQETDRMDVWVQGSQIALTVDSSHSGACPTESWFEAIGTDSVYLAWIANGMDLDASFQLQSANGGLLGLSSAMVSHSGDTVRWSGAFASQQNGSGELWMQCHDSILAYFAYGKPPIYAGEPTRQGLWNGEFRYAVARSHVVLGNIGMKDGDHFYKLSGKSGHSSEVLELRRDLIWKGRFFESNLSKVAKRLRITVYGDSDLYLEGSFAGQLSAPNAHVIVGQAAKEHAGQIQAKRITMHQGSHFQWVRWGL